MLALPIAWRRRPLITLVAGSMLAGLAGTTAYAAATAAQPHTGSIPSVGPASAGGGMGGGTGGGTGRCPDRAAQRHASERRLAGGYGLGTNRLWFNGDGRWFDQLELARRLAHEQHATLGGSNDRLQTAAELELSTGASVMAIGGFSGSDPSPTLAQFQAYVKAGLIHYFIAGGGMGGGGGAGSGTASQITSWVTATTRPSPSAAPPSTT